MSWDYLSYREVSLPHRHMYRLLFDDTRRATLVNESWDCCILPKEFWCVSFLSLAGQTLHNMPIVWVCLDGVRSGKCKVIFRPCLSAKMDGV